MKRTTHAAQLTRTRHSRRSIAAACSRAFGIAALSFAMFVPSVQAQEEAANGLRDIQIQSLPDRGIELRLIMRESAPEPLAFTIDSPARIVLDIPDTALEIGTRRQQVDLGPLDTVLMAEAGGRTRAVLNLSQLVEYETRVAGNAIIVTLAGGATGASTGATTFTSAPASSQIRRRPSISARKAAASSHCSRARNCPTTCCVASTCRTSQRPSPRSTRSALMMTFVS
mgnify:CR=1 FL=1